jgi:hypothetical protein
LHEIPPENRVPQGVRLVDHEVKEGVRDCIMVGIEIEACLCSISVIYLDISAKFISENTGVQVGPSPPFLNSQERQTPVITTFFSSE